MSCSWETESDPELDELISACLLNQCLGCALCQNSEFLTASRLIEELKKKIEDAWLEIDHLQRLRRLRCNHHFIVDRTAEVCARCGLHCSRTSADGKVPAKCISDKCPNYAEAGTCAKHNRPKLACSLNCYKKWKAEQLKNETED